MHPLKEKIKMPISRDEWIMRRAYQGHTIEQCCICQYQIPSYIGLWFHQFKTGHDEVYRFQLVYLSDIQNAS